MVTESQRTLISDIILFLLGGLFFILMGACCICWYFWMDTAIVEPYEERTILVSLSLGIFFIFFGLYLFKLFYKNYITEKEYHKKLSLKDKELEIAKIKIKEYRMAVKTAAKMVIDKTK